ncbi:putative phosphoserine phosphatase 2 [Clostridiales bacterium]|nr:putative phosphoserine phosphatase 2 [Clostridiales bacterium]
MNIILIRHGITRGNLEKRYIGITDESICKREFYRLKRRDYPLAEIVISSPMRRCIETAQIIYGGFDDIFDGLAECNFGEFENKNYEELKDNPQYQDWLDSGGTLAFPGGESMETFSDRCVCAFTQAVEKYKRNNTLAFIVHGGTVMAIARSILGGNFYDYHLKNGEYMLLSL